MRSGKQILSLTLLFVALCLVSIFFLDQPLALLLHEKAGWIQPFFGKLTSITDLVTTYSIWKYLSAVLVFAIGVVMVVVDKSIARARYFFFVSLTELTSRVVVGWLKEVFHRVRPEEFLAAGQSGAPMWWTGGDSFPSGHAGRYVGLFLPLMLLFPRQRFLLMIVPLYICLGRVMLTLHYLSDVFASVYLVIVITSLYSRLLKIEGRKYSVSTVSPGE